MALSGYRSVDSVEPRQISPFLRTKSFSASSVAHQQIVVSAPLETVISTSASGDLAVGNQSAFSNRHHLGREMMDGVDRNRGRSGSILQTWFGGGDGLNEVEQAELEIERMINKIRRDLSHMHDQDLYFAKWIESLGRKINVLETAVFLENGDMVESGRDEVDMYSSPYSSNNHNNSNHDVTPTEDSNPFSPVSTSTGHFPESTSTQFKSLSRSSSQLSATTASSGVSSSTATSADQDSDYSTDYKLETITERHPGGASRSAGVSLASGPTPRTTSCDSVDSLYRKSTDMSPQQGTPLSRHDSVSSGIHADELLAMYSKREKGVRQEMGFASQSSTPSKRLSGAGDLRTPSNTSLVHEHPDESDLADGDATPHMSTSLSPNASVTSESSDFHSHSFSPLMTSPLGSNQLANPFADADLTPKPALVYSEIFAPPISATESCSTPTSPGADGDFLTPRLSKRNSGIFGSVRLRASLRSITRGRTPSSSDAKTTTSPTNSSATTSSTPIARPEKPRWRWGGNRTSSSSIGQ